MIEGVLESLIASQLGNNGVLILILLGHLYVSYAMSKGLGKVEKTLEGISNQVKHHFRIVEHIEHTLEENSKQNADIQARLSHLEGLSERR